MCPTDRERKQALDRNLDRLKEAFDVLDGDGDGIIATADLELFLKEVVASKLISKEDVHSMLALVDGNVDFDQFLRLLHFQPEEDISVISREKDQEAFRAMFQVLDKNGDGFVCETDLKSVMGTLGRDMGEKDLQAMLRVQGADAGSIKGKVTYEEFVTLMTLPRPANGLSLFRPVTTF